MSNDIAKDKVSETSALPKSHGASIQDLKAKVGAGQDSRGSGATTPKASKSD